MHMLTHACIISSEWLTTWPMIPLSNRLPVWSMYGISPEPPSWKQIGTPRRASSAQSGS